MNIEGWTYVAHRDTKQTVNGKVLLVPFVKTGNIQFWSLKKRFLPEVVKMDVQDSQDGFWCSTLEQFN